MEPIKEKSTNSGVSTRSKTAVGNDLGGHRITTRNYKRKAEDNSFVKEGEKRLALGNLTNFNRLRPKVDFKENIGETGAKKNIPKADEVKQFTQPSKVPAIVKNVTRGAMVKVQPIRAKENKSYGTVAKSKGKDSNGNNKTARRLSNDFEKSESSLYVSAVEDLTSDSVVADETKVESLFTIGELPEGVDDFDEENMNDPNQVSEYAMYIFNYMKEREKLFPIADYMPKQTQLSKWMRSLLVDWLVEVQESFELNHETLYLAAKLVDLYLSQVTVDRDTLQLLGATSLLISSKFDERTPPLVEDFLYICDGAYSKKDLLQMEIKVLKTINFDLGIPISYRFLRRYARCAKVSMSILTLARYILEYSLMDYQTISLSDSKMACAALYIALKMNKQPAWTKTLEYYSGYKLCDFAKIVFLLNDGLHKKPKDGLNTIRNKYSHTVFHEVAKVTLVSDDELFFTDNINGK